MTTNEEGKESDIIFFIKGNDEDQDKKIFTYAYDLEKFDGGDLQNAQVSDNNGEKDSAPELENLTFKILDEIRNKQKKQNGESKSDEEGNIYFLFGSQEFIML